MPLRPRHYLTLFFNAELVLIISARLRAQCVELGRRNRPGQILFVPYLSYQASHPINFTGVVSSLLPCLASSLTALTEDFTVSRFRLPAVSSIFISPAASARKLFRESMPGDCRCQYARYCSELDNTTFNQGLEFCDSILVSA